MNAETNLPVNKTYNDVESFEPQTDEILNLNYDEIEIDLLNFLNERFSKEDLIKHNINFTLSDGKIFLNYENHNAWILYDNDYTSEESYQNSKKKWLADFKKLKDSNLQYVEDSDYIHYDTYFETPVSVVKLNNKKYSPNMSINYTFNNYEFEITINQISKLFLLSFFRSTEFTYYWDYIFQENRFKSYLTKNNTQDKKITLDVLIRATLNSVKLVFKNSIYTKQLQSKYIDIIDSCLYTLVVENKDVLNFKNKRFSEKFDNSEKPNNEKLSSSNFNISNLKYDSSLLSFYKAAHNSNLPSQKFLDFYHIFEFLFLRVSEDVIYDKVKSYVNHSRFRSSPNEIDKLISMIKKHNTENDETEMLKKVLNKFINEDDIIEYINENQLDKTLKSKRIFGETFNLSNKNGHAISNIANILKHVRNALVHSSDRYKREDCHIPFSESEKLVSLFLPIMDFLAQKVIAGTAETIS